MGKEKEFLVKAVENRLENHLGLIFIENFCEKKRFPRFFF